MATSDGSRAETSSYPWWVALLWDNPLRRLVHPPARIVDGLLAPGQVALDLGCGVGGFTVGMARVVGPAGQVVAVDVHPGMLAAARRRAARARVADRVTFHAARPDALALSLSQPVDFALAFWMLHEVSDPARFLGEVRAVLQPGAAFLLVEPRGHVNQATFDREIQLAQAAGFAPGAARSVVGSRAQVLRA